jgi:hypothetical protein
VSLTVDFVGLAEGLAVDLRGGLTLVGFHPPVLLVEKFPMQVTPTLVIVIGDDETPELILQPGRSADFQVRVVGPNDEVLFFVEQRAPIQARRWERLPMRLQLLAQVPVNVGKPGEYRFLASINISESSIAPIEVERRTIIADPAWLAAT